MKDKKLLIRECGTFIWKWALQLSYSTQLYINVGELILILFSKVYANCTEIIGNWNINLIPE